MESLSKKSRIKQRTTEALALSLTGLAFAAASSQAQAKTVKPTPKPKLGLSIETPAATDGSDQNTDFRNVGVLAPNTEAPVTYNYSVTNTSKVPVEMSLHFNTTNYGDINQVEISKDRFAYKQYRYNGKGITANFTDEQLIGGYGIKQLPVDPGKTISYELTVDYPQDGTVPATIPPVESTLDNGVSCDSELTTTYQELDGINTEITLTPFTSQHSETLRKMLASRVTVQYQTVTPDC
jgi:hypothetical protein